MRIVLKALFGGVLVPTFYLGMFAVAAGIVRWTHGDEHPSIEVLMLPLIWPWVLIGWLYSRFSGGNVFNDFPVTLLLLTVALDFMAYALLSYCVLWYEGRGRLA